MIPYMHMANQKSEQINETLKEDAPNAIVTPNKLPNLHPVVWIVIIVLVAVIAGGGVMLYMSQQQVVKLENQISKTPSGELAESAANQGSSPIPTMKENYAGYTDDRIHGMSFKYDSDMWSVTKIGSSVNEQGLEISSDHGTISIHYSLPFGVGGAASLFTDADRTVVEGNLNRLRNGGDSYQYGLENGNSITLFDEEPGEKQMFLDICEDQKNGIYGYLSFTDDECANLLNGNIVGVRSEPAFMRSITLKRAVPLGEINSSWVGDAYIESAIPDTNTILIETSYRGASPEEADKIVKQFAN